MRFPIWNELCTVPIGSYQLDDLPGCTQVCVSHAVSIRPAYRGAGEGYRSHMDRLEAMQEYGYDYALCTVAADNAAQRRILKVNGWKKLDSFVSSKTENEVIVYGRKIKHA